MTLEFAARLRLGAFTYDAAFAARDEIVVLFGQSGAGKSVTLQVVAGLMRPAAGRVVIDGEVVFDAEAGVELPPQRRRTGYVVQTLALFPHMTAGQNIAFGLDGRGGATKARVRELVALLKLEGLEERRPATLSVGQQQRVALARALARDARLLLLDEPFSALDESLRAALRRELLRLRAELGLSIVFVTHDLREAHLLADRIAVFDEGRVLQFDARETVFRRPANRRVAELTGVANIFRGVAAGTEGGALLVEVEGLGLRCDLAAGAAVPAGGEAVDVSIRAERVNLRRGTAAAHSEPTIFEARVVEEFAYGSTHTLRLEPIGRGPALEVELAARPYEVLGVAAQKQWAVELPPADLHVTAVAREEPGAGVIREEARGRRRRRGGRSDPGQG
ncbi:MAG: ABC transporter ATP-binding protein [Tepidiformaceae bacterium]